MGIIHHLLVNSQRSDQSDHDTRICFQGDIKTKSTGNPSLFSPPHPAPLRNQFEGYCLTSWENACPHGQPSFSPTSCYICHIFICTQVTVPKPCPLSEFYTNKALKICDPLIKLMYVANELEAVAHCLSNWNLDTLALSMRPSVFFTDGRRKWFYHQGRN